jgi:hypothetical protein
MMVFRGGLLVFQSVAPALWRMRFVVGLKIKAGTGK